MTERTTPMARRGLVLAVAGGAAAVGASVVGTRPARADDGSLPTSWADVRRHGAAGNGSTDDTNAFAAAITAAGTGGVVLVPAGTYRLSSIDLLPGQHLLGSGADSVLQASTGDRTMITVGQGRGRISALTIAMGRIAGAQPPAGAANVRAITATATKDAAIDLVVEQVVVRDSWGDGIRVIGAKDPADSVVVRDTEVRDCQGFGIRLGLVGGGEITHCRATRCRHGISLDECRDVRISNCVTNLNVGHGVVFTYSQGIHVDACRAEANGSATTIGWGICAGGIFKDPYPAVNSDFSITNNVCHGNRSGGITLDPTVRQVPDDVQVQRAVVSGNVLTGSVVTHGINVTHASQVVVNNNVCESNALSGIQVTSSRHVQVQGNTCRGNAVGIGLSSNDRVVDAGHHLIGLNLLYENGQDWRTEKFSDSWTMSGNRWFGLGGPDAPEGVVLADPGTLYQRTGEAGSLYVKEFGSNTTTGWRRMRGSVE